MRVSTRALPHWEALTKAMDEARPGCRGDTRFTADKEDLTERDVSSMTSICGSCPLRKICRAYAASDRPSGGFWAGRH